MYKLLRQTDPQQRESVLESVKGKLPDYLVQILQEGLSDTIIKARIKAESKKLTDATVEIPFQSYIQSSTSPWTGRILLPVMHTRLVGLGSREKESLEKEIYETIRQDVLRQGSLIGDIKTKSVGDYVSLVFDYQTVRGGLVSKLKSPVLDKSLKIQLEFIEVPEFDMIQAERPQKDAVSQSSPVKTIALPEGAVKYHLIPIRKEYDDFFPGYQVPFTLVTAMGVFELQRTSRRNNSNKPGNYITGGLRSLYERHQVIPGSQLVIRELEHHKRYYLDSVIHPAHG